MKRLYSRVFFVFVLVFMGRNAMSQDLVTDVRQRKVLSDVALKSKNEYTANHKKALALAKQKGWPLVMTSPTGTKVYLQKVDDAGFPLYVSAYNNVIAAGTTRTNTIQAGGILGLNLTGSSTSLVNKIAIWDEGYINTTHQEFAGKSIVSKDGTTIAYEHPTHVAGTMMAKGVYAPARGMAYGATSLLSYDYDNDVAEIAAASSGLLISNHSYGYLGGWYYDSGTGRWYWFGLPGDNEDYKFGFYDTETQTLDNLAFNSPQYLKVVSAGNTRTVNGPTAGSTYYGYNSKTDLTFVNKGARPANISNNDSYDGIITTHAAKNSLLIGAVNPLPNGASSLSDIKIAPFSSWGPTDDGRVKPDICGDGVDVLSTTIGSNTAYTSLSGTSMSSPNVSGSLVLLQEYYSQKNSGSFMMAATLKALVCHTAVDAGNPGPDYIYGWGLLDAGKAAQAITDNGTKSLVNEKVLAQGQTQTYNVVASGSGPLRATIAWTDPAATPTAFGVINSRTPKLVNDLDIKVTDGTNNYQAWVLNPDSPAANATTGDNIRDNVEQVYIANAVPGKSYTITVSHKGTLTNAQQAYSIVVTGVGGTAYCTSAPTSSADSRINNVTFAGINNTPSTGCTTYANYTNLTALVEQGKTYPLSVTLGTCGANFDKIAKVYIDWNNNGVFTDAGELVATSSVINGTNTFTANVTVPVNVVPDNFSLMRVVLTETTDATAVTPCGTYAKGETQDYRINFLRTSVDVGVTAINNPAANGTCPGSNSVSVHLKNYGTVAQTNIPVTVTITAAGGAVTTITDTYPRTLSALGEDDFVLSTPFTTVASASYTISATTTLAADAVPGNNQASATAVINTSPAIASASALFCSDINSYNLNATGDGTIFWYKNIGDIIPFTFGSNKTTTEVPINNTYYAGLNDFGGNVGPVAKSVFTAGGYNVYKYNMYVNTQVPMMIDKATLYVGNPGKVTFIATSSTGQIVSSVTLNVAATRTVPGAGAQTDDPADVGQEYTLNLALPAAGTYAITVSSFADGATLSYNNGGVKGYPFRLSNVFSIIGNNVTSSTDTAYYKNFYFYFYNMHVKSLGCASTAKIAVPLSKPVITLSGTNLVSNIALNNQWYVNGTLIPGATSQTYKPLKSGIYRVDVVSAGGCTTKSDEFSYVLPATAGGEGSEISLAVFPVPTDGQVNLAFKAAKSETLAISLTNTAGQAVFKDVKTVPSGDYNGVVNLSVLPTGNYIMRLDIGDKTYVKKVSLIK